MKTIPILALAFFTLTAFSPNAGRFKASIEPGPHFTFVSGAHMSIGNVNTGSDKVQSVITKPNVEAAVEYAFSQGTAIQLKAPLFFPFATIDVYQSFNRYIGVGAELGYLSSLYAVATAESESGSFVSVTPRLHLFALGDDWGNGFDNKMSDIWMNLQASMGTKLSQLEVAGFVSYVFMPGPGFEWFNTLNYFPAERPRIKHQIGGGVAVKF